VNGEEHKPGFDPDWPARIFGIKGETDFESAALDLFRIQSRLNPVYRAFTEARGIDPEKVSRIAGIPFLPIGFFKSHDILCTGCTPRATFLSSGTTGMVRSRHPVADPGLYHASLLRGFERAYGPPGEITFLALTPTPEEAPASSLVYMIRRLMEESPGRDHGFFLGQETALKSRLTSAEKNGEKTILIGLAYALLDFAEHHPGRYAPVTVIETGGMKGRRREIIREELHDRLFRALGLATIHSEYGMTELFSQAWSKGNSRFTAPPWMKVLFRDPQDPLDFVASGSTGGISVIDLANRDSCAFIATEDLGRETGSGTFEVLGRFDAAEVRGCSLMI